MKRLVEVLLIVLLAGTLADPALAWSCSSEETLAAEVSPEERAKVTAEIARQRALAEALRCVEDGLPECADMLPLTRVSAPVGK